MKFENTTILENLSEEVFFLYFTRIFRRLFSGVRKNINGKYNEREKMEEKQTKVLQ